MKIGVVVLTTGRRPQELELALDSVLAQRGVDVDAVVVGNGWEPDGLPSGVRGVGLAVDQGAPAGRNAGVPHTDGELVFFLDDDASLAEPEALARVAERFESDPELGLLQLRVDPREGGRPPRDWVPRLRAGDPHQSPAQPVLRAQGCAGDRHQVLGGLREDPSRPVELCLGGQCQRGPPRA